MAINRLIFLSLLPAAFSPVLTGCGPTHAEREAHYAVIDYLHGDYDRAAAQLRPLAEKTDENFVLNNARLGSAALAEYDLETAENAFLAAYEVINSTGVNSGGRGAAAAIVSERLKVWKGEPFEKAMVNYYLGLIYYMRHDYENARAAFENSLFKLRDYGESKDKNDEYRRVESNFALGYLMLAKSFQRLGNDDAARKNFDRAIELRPRLQGVADFERNAKSNVLLVIDYGYGPRRVTSEFDGSFVGFAPRPQDAGSLPPVRVIVDGKAQPAPGGSDLPAVDLLALAQDKRWQDIDTIRAVKDIAGSALLAGGGYEAYRASRYHNHNSNQDAAIAAGLIAGGLLLKASSQADTRTWEMLPRTSFVIPLTLPPGKHDITVEFPGTRSHQMQTWRDIDAPDKGDATYYIRIQNAPRGPYLWPPQVR